MSKEDIVKNRTEIVFLYDVRDNNPNGDPLAENKPRMDEETGQGIVTDVRLKRTIRDYLRDFENQTILIDDFEKDDGTIKMAKERAEEFMDGNKDNPEQKLINNCIDVRLFGAAIPLGEKKKSVQLTGPVQFNYGRSVHSIEPILLQGTGAFASKTGAKQRTFRTDYIIHYGLYRFYGIINEKLGELTQLKQSDVELLFKGMWKGTERLQSRSKVGHSPKLMIVVEYNEPQYFIGQIDKLVKLVKKDKNIDDIAIRDISEFQFDLALLKERLLQDVSKLSVVKMTADPLVEFKGFDNFQALVEAWKKEKIPIEINDY